MVLMPCSKSNRKINLDNLTTWSIKESTRDINYISAVSKQIDYFVQKGDFSQCLKVLWGRRTFSREKRNIFKYFLSLLIHWRSSEIFRYRVIYKSVLFSSSVNKHDKSFLKKLYILVFTHNIIMDRFLFSNLAIDCLCSLNYMNLRFMECIDTFLE